ncbi:hypothetical protein B296_00013932 [Ensete ventricosum]|uniref:Uncharacterized protein n=1 Tax=Ensete ventricosum TaxID=4639 RepID=A0A426ZFQ2_ENSVE|nr:hypothetical protein B296_00013932 [Ensete ventricosum]
MLLRTRQECIGSSMRVSEVCQDGTREFVRIRPRLTGRLSKVAENLVGSKPLVSDGCTITAQAFERLTMAGPLRLGG